MNISKEKFEQVKRDEYERGHKQATANMQIVHAADIKRIREDCNATVDRLEKAIVQQSTQIMRKDRAILHLSEQLADFRAEAMERRVGRLQHGGRAAMDAEAMRS